MKSCKPFTELSNSFILRWQKWHAFAWCIYKVRRGNDSQFWNMNAADCGLCRSYPRTKISESRDLIHVYVARRPCWSCCRPIWLWRHIFIYILTLSSPSPLRQKGESAETREGREGEQNEPDHGHHATELFGIVGRAVAASWFEIDLWCWCDVGSIPWYSLQFTLTQECH